MSSGRRSSPRPPRGIRSSSSSSLRPRGKPRPSPARLPTTIRGIVAARLDALPAAERAVLVDAAVQGKVFWQGGLERVTDVGDRLPELLENLERRDLIRRERVSAIEGDHQYAFKHVLIRDVAYELLPRARRRELHEHAAALPRGGDLRGRGGGCCARTALAGRRQPGAGGRLLRRRRGAGGARLGEGPCRRSCTARRCGLVPEEDTERRSALRRRLALAHQAFFHVQDAQLLGLGGDDAS